MDISPTRDLFGTPIVNIWGSKSFLSNFSSKILFEIKKVVLQQNDTFYRKLS